MAIDPAAGASMAGRPTICLRQSLSWFCFGSPTADAGPGRGAERARRTWHDTVMAAPTQIIVSPDWAATTDQHRQSESLGRGQHRSGQPVASCACGSFVVVDQFPPRPGGGGRQILTPAQTVAGYSRMWRQYNSRPTNSLAQGATAAARSVVLACRHRGARRRGGKA
jgi:hypothetical protein